MNPSHDERAPVLEPPHDVEPTAEGGLSRRNFLGSAAGVGAAGILLGPLAGRSRAQSTRVAVPPTGGQGLIKSDDLGPLDPEQRRFAAYDKRVQAAKHHYDLGILRHRNNDDDDFYTSRIGSYSKGLPHDAIGEVDPAAYAAMLHALSTGDPADFEAIPMGDPSPATRIRLTNPQSGLAFDIEGTDSHQLAIPPAPRLASAWEAGESVENYWMAHLRDVPFTEYGSHPLAQAAAAELGGLSDYRGPRSGGAVTEQTLFRDELPGTLVGPYISQFLLRAQPFGAQFVEPRMQTTIPGLDYMLTQADWLAIQNGITPPFGNVYDAELRYIRNGRDLGQWVHIDVLFQAYFQAMLAMLHGPNADPRFGGLAAPLNPGNPYHGSATQIPFGTFGGPGIAGMLCEVATRALKAVWFQKWYVHRRLRPEAYGGRVHVHITGQANYPLHADVLNSQAVAEAFSRNGTYFLPMAFPEGSPTHPAYGAGHATVAGACATVLKALFDADRPFSDLASPVVAAPDGLSTVPYTGADAAQMTVAGEINKLASNVATGRNIAGVHWRTDGKESLLLGEKVAISVLSDHAAGYNEAFGGFTFTKFDGTLVTV